MAYNAERALKQRVVLLTGPEDVLRLAALKELLQLSGALDDGFDMESFDGSSSKPVDWFASCGVAPFFAPRRVALVRHLLAYPLEPKRKADEEARLLENVRNVPATGLLILVADDEGGSDESKFDTRRKGWEKLVKDGGGHIDKFEVPKRELVSRLRDSAKEQGLQLSESTGELLAEMTGNSFSRAMEEMDKISLFMGKHKQIREEDVRAVVVPSREWNVFSLIDATLAGRMAPALAQARDLMGSGDVDRALLSRVFPLMLRSLRLAWQARVTLEGGGDRNTIPATVSVGFPSKHNLANESDYARKGAFEIANRLSRKQLAACFQVLAETEASLKGMGASFSTLDSLEQMLLKMGAVVKGKA